MYGCDKRQQGLRSATQHTAVQGVLHEHLTMIRWQQAAVNAMRKCFEPFHRWPSRSSSKWWQQTGACCYRSWSTHHARPAHAPLDVHHTCCGSLAGELPGHSPPAGSATRRPTAHSTCCDKTSTTAAMPPGRAVPMLVRPPAGSHHVRRVCVRTQRPLLPLSPLHKRNHLGERDEKALFWRLPHVMMTNAPAVTHTLGPWLHPHPALPAAAGRQPSAQLHPPQSLRAVSTNTCRDGCVRVCVRVREGGSIMGHGRACQEATALLLVRFQ